MITHSDSQMGTHLFKLTPLYDGRFGIVEILIVFMFSDGDGVWFALCSSVYCIFGCLINYACWVVQTLFLDFFFCIYIYTMLTYGMYVEALCLLAFNIYVYLYLYCFYHLLLLAYVCMCFLLGVTFAICIYKFILMFEPCISCICIYCIENDYKRNKRRCMNWS